VRAPRVAGVGVQGSLVVRFGGDEVPVMRVGYAAQHRVGHGLHGIERQRPLGGRASLRGARLRQDMAAGRPHHQRIRELRMRLASV
jgi:hypothetical protein